MKVRKSVETCRNCGQEVFFVYGQEGLDRRSVFRWFVFDIDFNRHRCKRSTVKVYTEEEKREFERKRLAGEI